MAYLESKILCEYDQLVVPERWNRSKEDIFRNYKNQLEVIVINPEKHEQKIIIAQRFFYLEMLANGYDNIDILDYIGCFRDEIIKKEYEDFVDRPVYVSDIHPKITITRE